MKKIISDEFELDLETGFITWKKNAGNNQRGRFKGNVLELLNMLSEKGYTEDKEAGTIVFTKTLKSDIQTRIWNNKGVGADDDTYRNLFTFAKKWQGITTYSAREKHSGDSCRITN